MRGSSYPWNMRMKVNGLEFDGIRLVFDREVVGLAIFTKRPAIK